MRPMTDTIETAVTPDPHAIARAVLLEVADEPDQVGDFVVANELEDHVTDFRFVANIRGYEGFVDGERVLPDSDRRRADAAQVDSVERPS